MIERFFVGPDALIGPLDGSFRRGNFAACGRRVSFPAMGKKPMAQATLSCPFGAIHLERHQRGELRMSASRSYSLTPWTPVMGARGKAVLWT